LEHRQWNKGFKDGDQGFNIKKTMQYDYDKKGVMIYTGDGHKIKDKKIVQHDTNGGAEYY
jgi:hypothetical protein